MICTETYGNGVGIGMDLMLPSRVRKKNPGILYIWLEADGNHLPGLVPELLRGLIRALRQTLWARLRGLTALCAAEAGATTLGTCVPRAGSTAARLTGTTASASALSAPSFQAKVKQEKADPVKCQAKGPERTNNK